MVARGSIVVLVAVAMVTTGCADLVPGDGGGFGNGGGFGGGLANGWAHETVQADSLREEGLTGAGVTIGIVDTGVHDEHAAFEGQTVPWLDVVNNQQAPYDDGGHGTHVSGLAVSQGTGGFSGPDIMGIAPGADLVHAKAIKGDGQGDGSDVAEAIDWMVDQRVDVLVLSLGQQPRLLPLGDAVEGAVSDALDDGIVVVAAAGNAQDGGSGEDCQVSSPATVPLVIAVGAVNKEGEIARFSCAGGDRQGPLGLQEREDPHKKPEVSAPGVELVGAWPDRVCGNQVSAYCVLSGTSQATPIVGGIVALLLEAHPDLKRGDRSTVEHVKEAFMMTAQKNGFQDHHARYGYGIVQGQDALVWLDQHEVDRDDGSGLPSIPPIPPAS